MDKKRPKQEDGSWVTDTAFLYALGKESGAIDDVIKAGKTYIPKLTDFISEQITDPTQFDPGEMSPGPAPGAEFSAASAPKTQLSPTAAREGASPLESTKEMLAGSGADNAAAAVGKQQLKDQVSRTGSQFGVKGAGEVVENALTGAGGAGAATLATAPAETTAMVGGLETAAGGLGAGAVEAGALQGAEATAAAAGTGLAPGVGTAIGLGIAALIAMFS
jgi:hypothetical protein